MRVNTRKFFPKEFHWKNYNCWDFVREVWLDTTGVDIGRRVPETWNTEGFRKAFLDQEYDVDGKIVHRIAEPENPCLVMLFRPGIMSHVGVFTNDKMLHLHPFKGVVLEPLSVASVGFDEVRFYK